MGSSQQGASPSPWATFHITVRELPRAPPASLRLNELLYWMPVALIFCHSRFRSLNPTPFRSAGGNKNHSPSLLKGIHLSFKTNPSMFNCSSHGSLLMSTSEVFFLLSLMEIINYCLGQVFSLRWSLPSVLVYLGCQMVV